MGYNFKETMNKPERFAPGHRMCAGCGATICARNVLRGLHEGDKAVIGCATGCLNVSSFQYPYVAWEDSYIHSAFENASSTMSGVEGAHPHRGAALPSLHPARHERCRREHPAGGRKHRPWRSLARHCARTRPHRGGEGRPRQPQRGGTVRPRGSGPRPEPSRAQGLHPLRRDARPLDLGPGAIDDRGAGCA